MARILLVEDEPLLANAVRRGLLDELHAVDVLHDGAAAVPTIEEGNYDLVILDLLLPGLAGLAVCRKVREAGIGVPILMLTARDAVTDVVTGLDAGADDYLTKPFVFEILLARVRTLLRREPRTHGRRCHIGPLELDAASHRAWRDGVEITLTATEFRLLELLVRHQGVVHSKAQIAQAVWDRDVEPDSNAIEVHIASLRRKVDRNRTPALIHTIRGAGYVVRVDAQ